MVQKQRFHRRGCERSKTYLERTLADEKIYNIPSAAFHKTGAESRILYRLKPFRHDHWIKQSATVNLGTNTSN
jgi:hypothetical protein